jgi:hypothetical protein
MPREVRIGLLGSGFIGEFHTLGLRYVPDVRVASNWGAGTERREAFAARFGSRALDSRTIVGALILTVLTSLLIAVQMPEAVRQILFGAIIVVVAAVYTRIVDVS